MGYKIDSKWIQDGDKLSPIGSNKVDISDGLTALYDIPVEQLTDGSYENWSIVRYSPDDYKTSSMGGTDVARSTDSHGGTYAALLTCDVSFVAFISDVLTNGGTAAVGDETLQCRVWGKRVTGSGNVGYVYECADGEDTYFWNFTGANADTWTLDTDGPGADQVGTLTLTSAYSQVTGDSVTVPSGYTDGVVSLFGSSSNSGDTIVIDDFENLVAGSDTATNGNFEAWTAVNGLDSWDMVELGGNIATMSKEETITYSGDYAVKMKVGGGSKNSVSQLISGTAAEELTCSYYARGAAANAGTVNTVQYFLNNTFALADEVWNKTTSAWEAYTDFNSLDSDNTTILSINTSETFTQDTAVPTIPASGKVLQVIYGESDADDDLIYVDLASIIKTTQGYGPLATVNSTTGKITFGGEIASEDATADGSAVNLGQLKSTGIVLLGSVTVDMTAIAATTIYTAVGNVMPLFITQRCATVDTISGAPTWSIGTNSTDFNNYVASGGATVQAVGNVMLNLLGAIANYPVLTDGTLLKLNVTTGATATAHTVTWDVFGIVL